MFFKKMSRVIFRNYSNFGYITDNRNFGYKKADDDSNYIGDKILSESGAVFFSALDNMPQDIDEIANKINKYFSDVSIEIIKNDAEEFYRILEKDRFIVSGETIEDCLKKDKKFSYKEICNFSNGEISYKDELYKNQKKLTQDFLEEYFCGKPQLTNLHIEITSKCNERCIHCYIPHEKKISEIDSYMLYNILEQCKNMNVLHFTISGGEPMLHKDFYDFIKKCREYNFSINILSNLTLLDNKIVKEMKENPLLGVQVSLYAMNPTVHDGITQVKGSFEKTKKSILKLIENDIPLQISCPIVKQNRDYYTEVIEWAKKYNVYAGEDHVIIAGYDHTTKNIECRLSIDEVKYLINEKIEKDTGILEKIRLEADKKRDATPDDFVCSVCNSSICIADNGNVYPCAGWQSYVLGNIKESSLNEIWDNSEKVHALRSLRKRDFPKCIQCDDKEFCTMCMVRNANESPTGDHLTVNEYFCGIAKFSKMKALEGEA